MSESIYLIDTPKSCFTCECCHTKDYNYRKQIDGEKFCGIKNINVDDFYNYENERKPDWCPLKELPEEEMENENYSDEWIGGFMIGWNSCFNEFLNGKSKELKEI